MYYSISMLSGNELGPRTTREIILGFSLLLISLGIGNLFVGEFAWNVGQNIGKLLYKPIVFVYNCEHRFSIRYAWNIDEHRLTFV